MFASYTGLHFARNGPSRWFNGMLRILGSLCSFCRCWYRNRFGTCLFENTKSSKKIDANSFFIDIE